MFGWSLLWAGLILFCTAVSTAGQATLKNGTVGSSFKNVRRFILVTRKPQLEVANQYVDQAQKINKQVKCGQRHGPLHKIVYQGFGFGIAQDLNVGDA